MSQEIETAQLQPTVLIGGVERQRIRYGVTGHLKTSQPGSNQNRPL